MSWIAGLRLADDRDSVLETNDVARRILALNGDVIAASTLPSD